jgi:hypothetical protein
MLKRRNASKVSLLCAGIAIIALTSGAKVVRAQAPPDLVVSMNIVPNPVSYGMGYAVQIMVRNLATPYAFTPIDPGLPRLPNVPQPPRIEAFPAQGSDVPQADLLVRAAVPPLEPVYGFIGMQAHPPLAVSSCQPAYGPYANAARCVIGPLPSGGSGTITLFYRAGNCCAWPIWFSATIDDRNIIAERNEANNYGGGAVGFQ